MSARRSKRIRAVLGRDTVRAQPKVYQVVKRFDKDHDRPANYPSLKDIHRARSHVQSGMPHPVSAGVLRPDADQHSAGRAASTAGLLVNPGAANLQPHARAVPQVSRSWLRRVQKQGGAGERARRLRQMSRHWGSGPFVNLYERALNRVTREFLGIADYA